MKKISLYSLLSIAVLTSSPSYSQDFEGMYVGGSIGSAVRVGSGNSILNLSTISPASTVSFNRNLSFDLKKASLFGSIAAGWGFDCDCYYLGLEGFVSAANYKRRSPVETINLLAATGAPVVTLSSSANYVHEVKLRPVEFGIDLRPGFVMCCDTMLYGRVGVAYNRLTVTSTAGITTGATSVATFETFPFSGSNGLVISGNKNVGAFRAGFGLERKLGCFSLRADYIYTYYGKVNIVGSSSTVTAAPAVTTTTRVNSTSKLYGYVGTLGLFYYF